MAVSQIELVSVPKGSVRFPVALRPPPGFRASRPSTWPRVEGRLEFSKGSLLYMPPCGEEQSSVAAAISWILIDWARRTPGFDVGGNEAGVILDGEVRGLDGGVWARTSRKRTTGYRRTPPLLAVEVQGEDETAQSLRRKAQWYLAHGVATVWLVLPEISAVVVVTAEGERRFRERDTLPAPLGLHGLKPAVADVFWRSK